jgi:hypothetical protein
MQQRPNSRYRILRCRDELCLIGGRFVLMSPQIKENGSCMPHMFGFRVVCVLLLIVSLSGIKSTVCRKNVKGFSFVSGGWTQGLITPSHLISRPRQ